MHQSSHTIVEMSKRRKKQMSKGKIGITQVILGVLNVLKKLNWFHYYFRILSSLVISKNYLDIFRSVPLLGWITHCFNQSDLIYWKTTHKRLQKRNLIYYVLFIYCRKIVYLHHLYNSRKGKTMSSLFERLNKKNKIK